MSTTYKMFPVVLSMGRELCSCSISDSRLNPNWFSCKKGRGKAKAKAPMHWPMVTKGEL